MKKLLSLEEAAQMALALYAIRYLSIHINYYWLIPAFFAPDLFAVGYLVNNRVGAILYNFSHHKMVALLLVVLGLWLPSQLLILAGLLAYAHSSFDRMIGYGLKYFESPGLTHLGYIGKEKHKNPADHW